ncbi:uncharacterized protein LOC120628126 [Pararge aegeria]|uniref:uncharacterized protein LOC120628126 n=1 Tax=Pararge aegeria TaxID=116150 RepID=UPI0019D22B53|nr:uncharacterized protein LOC120628126 [Pararge aegeria]
MSKTNKTSPKTIYCERYKRHLRAFNSFDQNDCRTVKKVIVSKKICSSNGEKSFSTGVISSYNGSAMATTKKTARSDVIFDQNTTCNSKIDYCKKCGDVASNTEVNSKSNSNRSQKKLQKLSKHNYNDNIWTKATTSNTNKSSIKNKCDSKPLQQYYRNEKFNQSTDSFLAAGDNIKKTSKESLNTIIEKPEKISGSRSTIFQIYPENYEEELGFIDPADNENIKRLRLFRKNNYFECHSVKSRLCSKGSVTSLNKHKCLYRFYLNDRLFPVPLNTDHQENIRCIECQLPLENNNENSQINGTVQAKVKLNGEIQDMLLMLPVKKSLIVKERRKVLPVNKDYESLYFGIIKLNLNGDSKFNRNLPSDSLALRYQKGYKELTETKKYEYDSIGKDDIIII